MSAYVSEFRRSGAGHFEDAMWLERASRTERIGHLFRNKDELGAVNLIKRVWHLAYLANVHKLGLVREAFDSVPAISIAPWRHSLRNKVMAEPALETAFAAFIAAVLEARSDVDATVGASVERSSSYEHFLTHVDAAVYHPASWDKWRAVATDTPAKDRIQHAAAALFTLQTQARLGRISPYYAVLAMDGDHMGKWLSGGKTAGEITQEWHASFSGQLSDFALNIVRNIVESHHGRLIYAGGDDVLAMLPATHALECALELHAKFSAIRPAGQSQNLTASIGHMKQPLQDMIAAAQHAEKLAKGRPVKKVFDRK
ncbi:MAG: type III-B CRISPR-associated protein Cas10/Cmr2, partial [Akkermansiaceae bacterium]|nr:type III-B CRISPR-associated protein Cas10/Cmr2 [Verrucomicrobiales bacterium]